MLANRWKGCVALLKGVRYLYAIWRKSRSRFSSAIAESLARLCVAALDAFPEALTVLRGWLQPLAHPDYVVRRLHEEQLCAKFTELTLEFLDLVIGDQTQWLPATWRLSGHNQRGRPVSDRRPALRTIESAMAQPWSRLIFSMAQHMPLHFAKNTPRVTNEAEEGAPTQFRFPSRAGRQNLKSRGNCNGAAMKQRGTDGKASVPAKGAIYLCFGTFPDLLTKPVAGRAHSRLHCSDREISLRPVRFVSKICEVFYPAEVARCNSAFAHDRTNSSQGVYHAPTTLSLRPWRTKSIGTTQLVSAGR